MKSYIGVTGFTEREQVNEALSVVPTDAQKLLMMGVLVSYKTLNGLTNKWSHRYHKVNNIAEIFSPDPRALNLIHYGTDEKQTLYDQLSRLADLGGENLHGFQLNIAWPDPDAIRYFLRRSNFKYEIVLQVGRHAFEKVAYSSLNLTLKLAEYEGELRHVLLDSSGGYGKLLDIDEMRRYLNLSRHLEINFGIAGGLSAATLDFIKPLMEEYPNLSIDAEGKLRNEDDTLNMQTTRKYIQKAFQLFS